MREIEGIIGKTIGRIVKIFQALAYILFGSQGGGCSTRAKVVLRISNARRKNKGLSASSFGEQLFSTGALLNISPEKHGVVAEPVRDILEYAWPAFREGCIFFRHEALDLEVAKFFFDDAYWSKLHGQKASGLASVGMGLPIDWEKWGSQEIFCRCGSLAATMKRLI